MPRPYVRKSGRATRYSKNDLKEAIDKVRNKELSNYAASKRYGIPKSTLNDRVLEKTGMISQTLGRPPAIPLEMESELAHCLRTLEKWGWGLSKTEVLDIAAEFVNKNKIKTPFKNNRPGGNWFVSFRERHNLSVKKPQPVEYLRKRMTDPFVIYEYFSILKNTLEDLKLNDPHRIWNLDETSVSLDPTKTKIVGGRGLPCTRTTAGTGKENITVLTTVNAAGEKLTPLIVFKGKYVYDQWMAESDKEYDFDLVYAASKRGWIESEIFYNYMLKIVIPGLGEERPVLMIYDGHVTHVDEKVVALAAENNITILKLPPHTSHLLQPLDLAVFKSFKSIWDNKLVEWQRQNIGTKIRKQAFAKLFAESWQQTTAKVIRNGFKKGGIYPYNSAVIPKEKFDPKTYMRWQKHEAQKSVMQPKTLQQLCIKVINQTMVCDTQQINANTNSSFEPENFSFENLLLDKLTRQSQNQNVGNNNKIRKKRVATGAEVITRTFLEKQTILEKSNQTTNAHVDLAVPGPSGVSQKKNNLSVPGPSGVSQKKKKKHEVTNTKTRSSIMKDKTNQNTTTTKGKGIGKKTRHEKENNINIDDHNIPGLQNTRPKKHVIEQDMKICDVNKLRKRTVNKFRKSSTGDTTPESIKMSSHSDSDLIDIDSDIFSDFREIENISEIITETQKTDKEREQEIEEIVKEIYETEDDLLNVNNNTSFNDIIIEEKLIARDRLQTQKQENCQELESLKQTDVMRKDKVTILSSVRFSPYNRPIYKLSTNAPPGFNLKSIDKTFDISIRNKNRSENLSFENQNTQVKRCNLHKINATKMMAISGDVNDEERPKIDLSTKGLSSNKKIKDKTGKTMTSVKKEREKAQTFLSYNVGDTVLSRYYTKVWKYYIGIIQDVNLTTRTYTISYYRTIRNKSGIKFVVPKRKDEDFVPEANIVKKIELLQINTVPEEYTLMNDEDITYF